MDPIAQSLVAMCFGIVYLAVGKAVERHRGPDGGGPPEWSSTNGRQNLSEMARLNLWNMRRFKWLGYFFLGWPVYLFAVRIFTSW